MFRGPGFAAAVWLTLAVTNASAQTRRPTPREALDRALAPVRAVLDEVAPTDEERLRAADLVARAEEAASELVEAEHRRQPDRVTARRHRIELLARAVRARVEATRGEAAAIREEQRALAAEERLAAARSALERAGAGQRRDAAPTAGQPESPAR